MDKRVVSGPETTKILNKNFLLFSKTLQTLKRNHLSHTTITKRTQKTEVFLLLTSENCDCKNPSGVVIVKILSCCNIAFCSAKLFYYNGNDVAWRCNLRCTLNTIPDIERR